MRKKPWAELAGALVVVAVALRYWLLYFTRGTNLLDEGSQAAQALRLIHGDVIYRDFFTVVTPGSYYTVAWLFEIFGTNLIVMRWAVVAIGLGIVLTTLMAARHLVAWPFAAATALMTTVWGWFLVTPNFYSLESALFSLIALACYLGSLAEPRSKRLVWAGLATGLAVLTKQNTGAYTAVALLLAIWVSALFDAKVDVRGRIDCSRRFIAGAAAPVVLAVIALVIAGAGPYLYESWIYYPLVKYPRIFAVPYPSFYPILPQTEWFTLRLAIPALLAGRIPEPTVYDIWIKAVLYLPVVAYAFAAVALVMLTVRARRGDADARREGPVLLAISLVGILTLLQAWPRADVTHILFGMHATFIVVGYLLFCAWRALVKVPGPRLAVMAAALAVTLSPEALLLWKGYRRTDWEYSNYTVSLRSERATGIRALGIEAQRIDQVTRYIVDHTTADEPIFVVPWAAGFYFLTDRQNPTRTDFMLFEDPEAYPCILSRLDARPPKYVIYGYTWDVDGKRFRDYARPLDAYIRSRYSVEASVDGYEVWRRIEGGQRQRDEYPGACQPRKPRLRDFYASGVTADSR